MNTDTLELVTFHPNNIDPKLALVRSHAAYYRRDAERALALIDACEPIVMRLPEFVLPCVGYGSGEWLQISSPTREQTQAVLSALHAGRWEKKPSDSGLARVDYEGVVDGIKVIIYNSEPPASCQIVEEPEYVPAHNRIRRTLVCH